MSEASDHPTHPLEPLQAAELRRAVQILRESGQLSESARFSNAALVEPTKRAVRDFRPGDRVERELRITGFDGGKDGGFDAKVSLASGKLRGFERIRKGQASLNFGDFSKAIELVKGDPDWQAAMRKRGIEDFSLVQIDPWPTGSFTPAAAEGLRIMRAISFLRTHREDNGYARPVEGVICFVDLTNEEVLRVEDHGVVPFPPEHGNYDPESVGSMRSDLRPIQITQPEGPSFQVEDHAIRWQKWRIRLSMHPTQGLVLHDVGYEDGGRVRPILHRAGLSDMVVPYGDVSPMHSWKHVFDAGEANLGALANSLKLGCDCLGEIHYFDATVLSFNGEPYTIPNAICMHEEDFGMLWKHTDMHSGASEVRRSRRLVVSAVHTVGNYEYGFFWYFYLDGTIQLEVKLTGIIGVTAVGEGHDTSFAPLIAPQLASPVHQHLFCVRLDFDLEGGGNSVFEVDTEPLPLGRANPLGTAFRSVETLLESESSAQRITNSSRSRFWKIVNPNVRNRLGEPVGYKLLPGPTPRLFADASSAVARRAAFATKNLWVTRFEPDELTAAGDFPNQHPGGAGLPAYTERDAPLENRDVVVWHSFGVTHVPRPEDWPVMPVEYCGFTLMPVGFFDRNPALDVPPSHKR